MRSLFTAALALFLFAGCSGSQSTKPILIHDTGTVRYQSIEGGFYAILGDGGARYDPVASLPDEMKVEGLRVEFLARPSRYDVSVRMWGQMIEIESIHRLE